MAHVMKMTRGAVGHMCKHYERAKDEKGEYVKFGNEDIDTSQSHMNYNLAPERNSQGGFIKTRCSEVVCLNRKDVNVACSWVVTLPKDFKEHNEVREREFFEGTYKFLEERYGKDNVVSAYVHMDETTPHMHFCFVPVIYDKKKEKLKVSAKEVVCKYDLQTFHNDLQGYLEQSRGIRANVLNEATIEGNKSIDELKRGTAIDQLNNALAEVQTVEGHIAILENDKNTLEGQIQSLEGEVLTLKEVNQVKIKKPLLLGSEKTIIQMPYQDAINLQRTAQRINEVDRLLELADKKLKTIDVREKQLAQERDEVSRIPLKDQMERAQLMKKNADLIKQISTVNKIMEKRPDLMVELQKEARAFSPIARNNNFDFDNTNPKCSKGFEQER
nr:unnamed protein product [uncultured bacterium]